MVPPTSMWTGAVYLLAAATHGIPVILWLYGIAPAACGPFALFRGSAAGPPPVVTDAALGGVGDDEFDIVGLVAGELLGDSNLKKILI